MSRLIHPSSTRTAPGAPAASAVIVSPWIALSFLAGAHFVVDAVATTINPLWPALERNLNRPEGGLLWVYVVWSLATSFTQLLFGVFGDRFRGRWLLWAGPVTAIVCLSALGLAHSAASLAGLFLLAGLGVAAFHPEGGASAGALLPSHRSRFMAVFSLSGFLGQAVGPFYAGALADRLGLTGLLWTAAWALPAMLVLTFGLVRIPTAPASSHAKSEATGPAPANEGRLLLWLLVIGALRIMPALGVPLALAYLLNTGQGGNAEIGAVQSIFMAGIGAGGVMCATLVRQRHEWTVLWLLPLAAAPVLWGMADASGTLLQVAVGVSGFLLGVAMPVYISYGQQLLPRGQRVASSITMGVSWGLSGALVAGAIAAFQRFDALRQIFLLFAAACVLSSMLCRRLPRIGDV